MENKFQERLLEWSTIRGRLLNRVLGQSAGWLEGSSTLFHTGLVFTTVMVVVSIFMQLRSLQLFAFHPIFMTIGTFCCFAQGIVAYRNKALLEVFGPIMQHSKRVKVRVIHQSLQLMGVGFLGMGLLSIFANKAMQKKSILPQTLHSVCGTVAVVLVVIQGVSGSQKMVQIESKISGVRIRKWHGESGLLLWDLLCVTILLGLVEFLNLTFTNICVEICVAATWVMVHAQMRRKDDSEREVEATYTSPSDEQDIECE